MTTPTRLKTEIDRQAGVYARHPSVAWFNQKTGQNYVPDAYFCASGLSQAFDRVGLGKATGGPFIWTVAWYQWCKQNLKQVPLSAAQPGDILFFKFGATGDRGGAPVNHVTTYRGRSGTSILVKGFNEGSGGTGGIVGNAAYHQTYLVACFRTPFQNEQPKPIEKKGRTVMEFRDPRGPKGTLKLPKGAHRWVCSAKNPGAGSATNLTREGSGLYDVRVRLRATGTPGDTLTAILYKQEYKKSPRKNVSLERHTVEINSRGSANVMIPFNRKRGEDTYTFVKLQAGTKNKGPVTISRAVARTIKL